MGSNCTNCGEKIEGIGILSPTTNQKRRQQCLKCASKFFEINKDYVDNLIFLVDNLRKHVDYSKNKILQEKVNYLFGYVSALQ